jgi:hypothetical protein
MSGVRLVWALVLALTGCAPAAAPQVATAPPVTASLPAPPPARAPALTERDAIALVRTHLKPSIWIALHTELRDHAAGKALVSSFASSTFEQAKIDPGNEIDALVSGCAKESGCFTLFEHHIAPERIRRFLDLTAEKSTTPAEWLTEDPPTVRVTYADDGKGVAVLTQVNENLLLASLRPAPGLVEALQTTRGLEASRDGYVAVGGMTWMWSNLEDGLNLRIKIAPDGALAGDLRGTAVYAMPMDFVSDEASHHLKRRFDFWWLPPGIFTENFRFEIRDRELFMPVRIEPSLIEAIASGLRLVMRFR